MRTCVAAVAVSLLLCTGASARDPALTAETINAAEWAAPAKAKKLNPSVLKAQVMLDRAGFSPGVIDAHGGENFEKALRAFQGKNGLEATGKLDQATWTKLAEGASGPAVTEYTVAARDLKGPFVKKIPKDYEKMGKLDRLGYRGPREALAEKFHMSEDLLAALNPGKDFRHADSTIVVANVGADAPPAREGRTRKDANTGSAREPAGKAAKAARVEVNKSERSVRVFGEDDSLVAYFPASIGSSEKPAPSGKFEVRAVAENPTYRYNPEFGFKGQKAKEPVEIAPGPNNPVGAVWIALSAETYGIHGTPEPDQVSKTASHGCIRLTNWDALALAKLVKKGTPVEFVE
ncbi:MAG TPA: L,D-transpeptidase [Xanthobacteraceae bacterium]